MRYLCSCNVQVLRASEFCCLCFQVLVLVCFHVCSLFLLSTLSVFCPFVISVSNVSISVYCPVPVSSLCLFLSLHYFLFYFVQRLSHICSDLLPLSHNPDYFLCSLVYSITSLITSCVFKPLVFFNWWSPLILLYVFSHLCGSVSFQSVCSSLNALCVVIFALAS